MAQVLTSVSGIQISAASAGHAPTNSGDVSAIASGYQVVSATGTQLYAGTAYVTSINSAPLSASRAGNAANASMANSAYYDGTGRLISSLPDAAEVSAIASSYADDKLDKTAEVVTATAGDGMYVTSINGMGLSGQGGGGAQVVTATGSASAATGWWPPFTTSYLVSSINGSAILPYGYSSLSANSANWNNTRTAVTANSANWNSVYNTVSTNSASWSGSTGGSVASPSGTIFVKDGTAIEGTNSAALTASVGEGFEVTLPARNQQLGPQMQPLTYDSVPDSGATLIIPLRNPAYKDIQVILSGMGIFETGYGNASASGIITSGAFTASIPMDRIMGDISASASEWFDLANAQLTAKKEGGIVVTGVGELAWKSAVDNVTNTVATNSASWGAGASIPITGSAGDVTATYEMEFLSFVRNDTAGEPDIRTASLSTDQLCLEYTLDGIDRTSVSLTESMLDFMDSDGDHVVDAYSIDNWNSAVNTVANNSASWGGGATGDYVEKSATLVTIGSNVSANGTSFVQGDKNTAAYFALVQGLENSGNNNHTFLQGYKNRGSGTNVLAQGSNNSAFGESFAQGIYNKAERTSVAQGDYCSASDQSFSQGYINSASVQSFAQGYGNFAYNRSFAQGIGLVVKNTAAAFGAYNLSSDGDTSTGNSAAFAIGDGSAANARHNLMLVTKDGEITMYSSTADTVGTGIMSSIRAISAAAGGGDVYISGFGYKDTAISAIEGSALYDKSAHSRITTVAGRVTDVSAAVSGTVDLVSTQSANWGGSALGLRAGPGISITIQDGFIVIGTAS